MAEQKVITFDEFKAHGTKDSFYVLLHGNVYDATKFLDEHPGGDEVILAEAGKDATEAFEDVGHSDEARDILKTLLIGTFDGGDKLKSKPAPPASSSIRQKNEGGSGLTAYLFPLAFLGVYFAWRFIYA